MLYSEIDGLHLKKTGIVYLKIREQSKNSEKQSVS